MAHTGNMSRDALPSSRGDVFAAMFFVLRIQSADATEFTGPFQLQKTFDSSGQCSNRAVGTQGQRKDIVSGQEICSDKCHECQVFISELLLAVLPLLARPDTSSFVCVHFCRSPSRHGVRSVHSHKFLNGTFRDGVPEGVRTMPPKA